MAKGQSTPDTEMDFAFPLEGVEETRSYIRQRPGTTVGAQNVRTFDPRTGRARGGSRPGMAKYLTTPINGASAPYSPIQDIIHLTSAESGATSVPTITGGQFVYANASGSGFRLGTGATGAAGASDLGATAGYEFMCSCWDDLNNVYVATRKQSDGTVKLYAYTSAGVLIWGPVSPFTIATGANRNIAGMVVINTGTNYYLFIAAITTSAAYGTAVGTCKIHRLFASSGNLVDSTGYWQQSDLTTQAMYFSTNSHNCLGKIGTVLGVDCIGTGTNQSFRTYSSTAVAGSAALTTTPYGGTQLHGNSKVVSDGSANFYVIASVSVNQVKKIGLNGTVVWSTINADQARSLAFDSTNQVLAVATGATPTVRKLDLTTAAIASGTTTLTTVYDEIDSDNNGTFFLWKNAAATLDVAGVSTTFGAVWGPSSLVNTTHTGSSANRSGTSTVVVPVLGSRITRLVLVAGGYVKTVKPVKDVNGVTTLTLFSTLDDSTSSVIHVLDATKPVVFSAPSQLNLFFADGQSTYKYYNASTDKTKNWTPTSGTTMPVDTKGNGARLICLWRGRLVLAGFAADPNQWFMSAVNQPFNWNYSVTPTTTTMATNGTVSPAGLPGDAINCIIPYTDDTLVFGCDHAIRILRGDPMAGGQFDWVTETIGMAWGRPYAIDPMGQIYFWSNQAGIWKMTPGALPVRISQQIEKRIEGVNLSGDPSTGNIIRMAWDLQAQGLWVWVTPLDPTKATTNFFFEERTNAWWPDVYANKNHQPRAVYAYDGDLPTDRVILVGSNDGYLRMMGSLYSTDDATPISSFVFLGPLETKLLDEILMIDLQTVLSSTSGTVTYSIYVGKTAEAALASTPAMTGTWIAERNPVSYVRRSGQSVYLKLSATTPWALESIRARYAPLGRIRRRAY